MEKNDIKEKSDYIKSESKIQIVENGKTKSVIFQSEYAKDFFKSDSTQNTFFNIDNKIIKDINENLEIEYCKAIKKWSDNLYDSNIKVSKENNNTEDVERFQKDKIEATKDCEIYSRDIKYCDRQLIGMNNIYGKKIILIQLLDFRVDPSNYKKNLEKDFIIGYHGWFESNVRNIFYLVEEKRFVMSMESE